MNKKINILPLVLDNVSLSINGMRYIKDMNFQLDPGPSTVILGPNGAGKSLFLRLCHGLISPSSGSIDWQGPAAEPHKFQAIVFQKPVMLRSSVSENLHFGLRCKGLPKSIREPIIEKIIETIGLTRLSKIPARSLSAGEQQRLAIGRAWSLNPEVLWSKIPL